MQSQQTNLHKNVFSGGLNKDTASSFIANEQYFDAQNVSLIENNKFLALQNIKGTSSIGILPNPAAYVLGIFPSKYKIGTTENVDCLTIFTATAGGNINIYCYSNDTGTTYELYGTTTPLDY